MPERLRGEIASFDIQDENGKVIVEAGRRITARHIDQIEKAEVSRRWKCLWNTSWVAHWPRTSSIRQPAKSWQSATPN